MADKRQPIHQFSELHNKTHVFRDRADAGRRLSGMVADYCDASTRVVAIERGVDEAKANVRRRIERFGAQTPFPRLANRSIHCRRRRACCRFNHAHCCGGAQNTMAQEVLENTCIGVSDARTGEAVKVFVVGKPGSKMDPATIARSSLPDIRSPDILNLSMHCRNPQSAKSSVASYAV